MASNPSRHKGKGKVGAPKWGKELRDYIMKQLSEFVGVSDLYDLVTDEKVAKKYGFKISEELWVTFLQRCKVIQKTETFQKLRQSYLKRVDEIPVFHTINRLKILQGIINNKATKDVDKVAAVRQALKETTREAELLALAQSGGKTLVLNNTKYEITADVINLLKAELNIPDMIELGLFSHETLLVIQTVVYRKLKEIEKK